MYDITKYNWEECDVVLSDFSFIGRDPVQQGKTLKINYN